MPGYAAHRATAGHFGRRFALLTTLTIGLLAALAPSAAQACSVDDNNFLESFLDASCIQSQTNTTLDAQGGVRLTTNGTPVSNSWDTDTDFDNGITHQSVNFPAVGVSTLTRSGTGAGATLGLPTSSFPLQRNAAAVLAPPSSSNGDNDNVEDPSVIKVGSTYVMYYTGTAEDGTASEIFQATSPDGQVWTRANGGAPVLAGTAGAFDEFGVSGAEVHYDVTDVVAPYKMWFAGQGSTFGAIGYATSTDGINWNKYDGGGPDPLPVLDHGRAGSADSFAAADPSVIKDGTTWKMWYTGDDSSMKRIAYATSADGIDWSKGGSVIAPEDAGVSNNVEFGAYSPSVYKISDTNYRMLLVGRKLTSGTYLDGDFETKVMDSSSSDGINWAGPSPSLNPQNGTFAASNLDGPDVLADTGATPAYKAWYTGNSVDANGNFHSRIGYATSGNGSAFGKVSGSGTGGSVLDINTAETEFDARAVGGLSAVTPAGAPSGEKFVGFYAGVRGSDFTWRVGGATSPDATAWTRMSDGAATGGSLLPLGNPGGTWDSGGHRDPWGLYDSSAGSPHRLYVTALTTAGVMSIATSATTEDADKGPVNSNWSNPAQVLTADGVGFDSDDVSHPSVIKDGATYRLYYTGTSSTGVTTIGYSSSASATAFTNGSQVVADGAAGSFDDTGVKDPVVWKAGAADYRMIYTGVATENGRPVERLGYATSTDGASWTKSSPALILNPSAVPFNFDEKGVAASGVVLDGSTPHVLFSGTGRDGRSRGGYATNSVDSQIPNGWATYQLGDATTTVRDFREITRTSTGSVTLWMSFLQPYSTGGEPYWSDFFPVTVSAANETLNFLLTIRGVRWQARMTTPSSTPSLNTVALDHAPVSFNSTGTVATNAIAPPVGLAVSGWGTATVNSSLYQPNGGGAATAQARVLNANTNAQVAVASLNTGGDTVIDLSGVSVAANPSLRVAFDLNSADGQASPLINSLQVTYNKETAPPVVTLASSAASTIHATPVTLSGTVTRAGAPQAGQPVNVTATPVGGAAAIVGTAVTDGAGAYSLSVTPDRHTTYVASSMGVDSAAATVQVAELIKLKVRRKGTKGYASGSVGPVHAGKIVLLQQKKGSRWVTLKKLKTSSTSGFKYTVTKLAKKGKYQFRAQTAADAEHLAGMSAIFYSDPIKMSLAIKRSGRTLVFSGKASPAHPRKAIVIKVLKGTTWSTFAKLKLSSRSTYSYKKKVAAGTYRFRVDIAGDRDHWPGKSAEKSVIVP